MGNLIVKKRRDSKRVADTIRAIEQRRLADAKRRAMDEEADEEDVEDLIKDLTADDINALKELIPFKEALIKIAKGEFEIERIVEEDDEDEETEEVIEEDEELAGEEDENFELDEDLDSTEEETTEDSEMGSLEDSEEINEAWRKRLGATK